MDHVDRSSDSVADNVDTDSDPVFRILIPIRIRNIGVKNFLLVFTDRYTFRTFFALRGFEKSSVI